LLNVCIHHGAPEPSILSSAAVALSTMKYFGRDPLGSTYPLITCCTWGKCQKLRQPMSIRVFSGGVSSQPAYLAGCCLPSQQSAVLSLGSTGLGWSESLSRLGKSSICHHLRTKQPSGDGSLRGGGSVLRPFQQETFRSGSMNKLRSGWPARGDDGFNSARRQTGWASPSARWRDSRIVVGETALQLPERDSLSENCV